MINDSGFNVGSPIDATDNNLLKATENWYPDAPLSSTKAYTVEDLSNYSKDYFAKNPSAGAITQATQRGGVLTGNSKVFFNADVAFSSAEELYKTIGHELIHVSQFSALAGESASILTNSFSQMMEFHAYNFRGSLAFPSNEVRGLMQNHSHWFPKLSSTNFNWTYKSKSFYNIFN